MGVSLSTTAAIIGISFIIILQAFSVSVPPKLSEISDAYDDMKDRSVEQCQTDVSITNITDVGWWDTDWAYRKMIVIDHTKVQADQTDFTALVYINSDVGLAAHAQPDGDDIFFTDDNNSTKFSHEIEKYDDINGELTAWVKIPIIYTTKDTVLFMYYGNAGCISQQDISNTWDSNFKMVHHLNESSGALYDSTSNNNDGTNNGATYNTSSKIDGGYDFDGSVNINCGNDGSLDITNSITLEAWIKDPPSTQDKKNVSKPEITDKKEEGGIFGDAIHRNYNLGLIDFLNRFSFLNKITGPPFNKDYYTKHLSNKIKEETILKEKEDISDNNTTKITETEYNKSWNYVLAKANWNLHAHVDGEWKNVDGLKLEYVKVTSGLKKFSLAFTASIKPQADYLLNLTIDIPIDDYSFDYENKTFNLYYTVFGEKIIFKYNYSDIAILPGLIFKHGISDGKFWFSIQKNNIPYGTLIYLDPTYGLTADQVTNTYEYDEQEGHYCDAVRLGSDGTYSYFAIVSTGDTGAENDGYIRTIKVWESNGTIVPSLVDWLEYDTSDGYGPSIINVGTDMYAIAYSDLPGGAAGRVTVVTIDIDSVGNVDAAVTDTQQLSYRGVSTTSRCNILHLTGNIYVVAYTDVDGDGWIETVEINSDGTITNSVLDSEEFDGADGFFPHMAQIDVDTVAVIYETTDTAGGSATARDGMLMTYNISGAGLITDTPADSYEYDTDLGRWPDILHISGDVYLLAHEGTGNDGFVRSITIDSAGDIGALIDFIEFDTGDGGFQTLFYVTDGYVVNMNVFGVSYQGGGGDGWVGTFTVDNNGNMPLTVVTDNFEYDTVDTLWYAPVLFVSGTYWLVVHVGTGNDGFARTFQMYMNYPLVSSDESPSDGATGVQLIPELSVNVSEVGDFMTAYWLSNSSGSWAQFGVNSSILGYGTISDSTTFWEYDQQEGHYPNVIRLGTSNYYAIVSTGDTGAENDGYIRVVEAWNTNGTIRNSLVDVPYEYDGSNGQYPRIQHISGDIYAIAYVDTGAIIKVVTTEIDDADGDCTGSIIDTKTMSYAATAALPIDFINVINNVYAVAYTNLTTLEGLVETITINNDGSIDDATLDFQEFDATNGRFPRMCMVDTDTVAIQYYESVGSDGWLVTYNISGAGVITDAYASQWEYDADNGIQGDMIKIDGNIFALAYEGTSSDGYIKTTTINDDGSMSKTWIDTYEHDKVDGGYQRIHSIGNNIFVLTYQCTGADGRMKSFYISSSGDIASYEYDELEYDTADTILFAPMVSMGNDYYLIAWAGTGNDGFVGTVEIGNSTKTMLQQANANFSARGKKYWWSVNVTDGISYNNQTYSFTTKHVPTITNESPINQSVGISLNPTLSIQINHSNGYQMNITWYWGTDNSCPDFIGTNSSVNNGTYNANNDNNFSSYNKTYYWRVIVNDEYGGWTNKTYHFTTFNAKEIINKGRDAYSLEIGLSGTTLYGYVNSNSVQTSIDTNWHYVTLTYDGSQLKIYKDGEFKANTSMTGNINTNGNDLLLGRYLTGTLDEIRISNTARSAAWINTTYKMTSLPESFVKVETEQNQQYTYLKIKIKNTGSTTIKMQYSTILVNGTEKPFSQIQSCLYPLKETNIFVNVSASGPKRNKFITGNGITKYEGYG